MKTAWFVKVAGNGGKSMGAVQITGPWIVWAESAAEAKKKIAAAWFKAWGIRVRLVVERATP